MSRAGPVTALSRLPASLKARRPSLSDPVQYVAGVGPRRAAALKKLGIQTISDLLEHAPFRHERHFRSTIELLEPGQTATIVGRIEAVRVRNAWAGRRRGRGGGPSLTATVIDNTGRCSLQWFNAPYVTRQVRMGAILRVTGRVSEFGGLPQFVNPAIEPLDDDAEPIDPSKPPSLEPVYPATAEIPSAAISRIIRRALPLVLDQIEEWHTPAYRGARELLPRARAFQLLHVPDRETDVASARRRLAYDELLLLQLAVLGHRRAARSHASAPSLTLTPQIEKRIRQRLPFDLTKGQEEAVREISADMARPVPMMRLLQGDVGSGKTLVAIFAALVAIANRAQVAIMAPTELLAEQLFRNADRYLAGSRVRRTILTGSTSRRDRAATLERIASGELDFVVGTQALIERDLSFSRLGLVIVDEQHRFGVRQRTLIRCKGTAPHYLVMSATPIPRTLAMTVFGDLDVTTLFDKPAGRSPIRTRVVPPLKVDELWSFVRARVASGEQAYVICPLVAESDQSRLRAATAEFERLRSGPLVGVSIGLVHGRLKSDARQRIMSDFAAGRIAVLVGTTVVEVGIDVPAATIMVIQHAERYGLAQLHQLRGRVGRGQRPGYCFLMTDRASGAEHERLSILTRVSDGFRIADEDLRLRGPGEVLGARQHGLPEFRFTDLAADGEVLRLARRDAVHILRADPDLSASEHDALRRALAQRFKDRLAMGATA
ncbi:MAG: ATP-dependent DNA helicase RecG [Phycisphaerae bacterium]|nr:ATP-dependent DNA helicase RecG [Phycisphaerae bacterium]